MPRLDFVSKRCDWDNATGLLLDSYENNHRWRIAARFQDTASWEEIADAFKRLSEDIREHGQIQKATQGPVDLEGNQIEMPKV